ncbi:transcriptional regulator [Desulfobacterota bacterium AH_259_B03_O07]|nr:transcriptional regulator [Desulfobacterota bacterium AH_259_B03_O07]
MARTISDRLAATAITSFVGREQELDLLRGAIEASDLPFVVAYIHGIGGIGKTRLLQATLSNLDPEITSIKLDCREIEPTQRGFLQALGNSLNFKDPENETSSIISRLGEFRTRTVLALDTYETFGLMDTWIRQEFVPSLPDSVFIIINSRERPNAAWLTTPGWETLFRDISLHELPEDDAHKMLRLRGLNQSQIVKVNSFARGYPLALELASAAIRNQPDLDIIEGPPREILQQLTESFLTGLQKEIKKAIEAASTVRRITEPVLRSLLGKPNVGDIFDKLQELPFVNATDEGLILHDLVRETISNNLSSRDPERYSLYRSRAWHYFDTESHRTEASNLWQCTADLLYLIENPGVKEAFFPKGASDYSVEPATATDWEDIRAISASTEPVESSRFIERWLDRHPEAFIIARARDGSLAAFLILFEPADVDPELLAKDPLTSAWSKHLNTNPIAKGERVLFLRRWLTRSIGEAPSPAQAACWLDVKRTYMELRPNLRRVYTTVIDLPTYAPSVSALGFVPIEQANVVLGGITYNTAMLDFGPASVDDWLKRLIGAELGIEREEIEELPEGTVTILFADIVDSTMLTEKLSDDAFRSQARILEESLKNVINESDGKMVEGILLGDGVMAVFKSARKAIECAIRCNDASKETELRLHLGLHAGDVIKEGKNVFGGAVNIASRIADISSPGEIIVSETVRSLARTSTKVTFEDKGLHNLKGVSDPHRVFVVRFSGQ